MVNLGPLSRGYQPPPTAGYCPGYWPDRGTPCRRALVDGECRKGKDPDHGYALTGVGRELDPRWEWTEMGTMQHGEPPEMRVRGACRHQTPLPVTTADRVEDIQILVAWLCPDCDEQFEPDRFRTEQDPFGDDDRPEPWTRWPEIKNPNGFEKWVYPPPPAPRVNPALITPREESAFRAAFLKAMTSDRAVILPHGGSMILRRSWRARSWSGFLVIWNWMKSKPGTVAVTVTTYAAISALMYFTGSWDW